MTSPRFLFWNRDCHFLCGVSAWKQLFKSILTDTHMPSKSTSCYLNIIFLDETKFCDMSNREWFCISSFIRFKMFIEGRRVEWGRRAWCVCLLLVSVLTSCVTVSGWTWCLEWVVLGSGPDSAIYLLWSLGNLNSQFFICKWGKLLQGCCSELIWNMVPCGSQWHCPYKIHALVTLLHPLHFLVAFSSAAFGKILVWSWGFIEMMIMLLSCFFHFFPPRRSQLPYLIIRLGRYFYFIDEGFTQVEVIQ